MSQNHDHSGWEAIVLAARERAGARQASMAKRFGLAGDVQYDWSLDEARITWSRGGTAFLSGRVTMIGSVSVPQQTWLWSWANPSLPVLALGEVDQVRRYGEANDFPVLPWKSFSSHPDLVAEARVVAAWVLDAEGLWFDDLGDVQLHFLIHDLISGY